MNRNKTRGRIGYCTILLGILVSLALVVSACGPGAAPTATPKTAPSGPTPTRAIVATPTATTVPATPTPSKPTPAGMLRVAWGGFSNGLLDPAQGSRETAARLSGAIFDALVGATLQGTPGPGIAERWEMSPDGKTWTFYIRKGVKFHDGSDLTGADVKFSIDRILSDPKAQATNAAQMRGVIQDVEIKDPYTVVFHLKAPDPELWLYLTTLAGGTGGIVPKKYVEERGAGYFTNNPIGTGPWKLVKYDFGNVLELEVVEGHWRATPQFKRLVMTNVLEQATRVALLKTDGTDLAEVTADAAVDAKKTPGIRTVSYPEGRATFYATLYDVDNRQDYVIGDKRVRKALALAINRQEMADVLFSGYASPSMYPIPRWGIYYDPDLIKADPYDPNEARRLLAEAGYPSGFDLRIVSATGMSPALPPILEAASGYWSKIGVRTSIVTGDWAAYRPLLYGPGGRPTPELVGKGTILGLATASLLVPSLTTNFPSTATTRTHKNAEVDALVVKAVATIDPAQRKKLIQELWLLWRTEYGQPGLLSLDDIFAVGKNVADWTPMKGAAIVTLEYERIPRAR